MFDVIATGLILAFAMVAFARELFRSDMVAFVVMALLVATGVLSPKEAVAGFSSEATIIVACMFIVSAAVVSSGGITLVVILLEKFRKSGETLSKLVLMSLTATISAFFNNTATVAVLMPAVIKDAEARRTDRRKMLMPLSYAAIFGGACTLIGSSTNILANSIYTEISGRSFGMFEFSKVGILLAAIGISYMLFFGSKFLSEARTIEDIVPNSFLSEVELLSNSPSVGKVIQDSPIYKDFDGHVVAVYRAEKQIFDFSRETFFAADRIQIVSDREKIAKLKDRLGIAISTGNPMLSGTEPSNTLYEVIVPANSDLIGKPLSQIGYLHGYEIFPIGLRHRGRLRMHNFGRFEIRAGDIVLVAGFEEKIEALAREQQIVRLDRIQSNRVDYKKLTISGLVSLGMILGAATGVISIAAGAIVASAILLITKTVSIREAYRSIDAKVLMLLACILSLGVALEKVGMAKAVGSFIATHAGTMGPVLVMSVLYLFTSILTEIISNNATVAILVPVAFEAAKSIGVSDKPLLVAVMMASSASFMTPIGYQTNTLIYGSGSFRFADFFRVGAPLNLVIWIAATALIPLFFPF
jgi:di/tricarboxylate transporter